MGSLGSVRRAWIIIGTLGAFLSACGDEAEPIYVFTDLDEAPFSASFAITVDPNAPELDRQDLSPIAGLAEVERLSGEGFALDARVKRIPAREGLLKIELLVGTEGSALRDVSASLDGISGTDRVFDGTNDPFADEPADRFVIGGVVEGGITRAILLVPYGSDPLRIELTATGTPTRYRATSASPIALTPDGEELWAPFPDADVVAVIDTASQSRIATVDVPGRPTSIALTPDGRFALVSCMDSNEVWVIDRTSRAVTQRFGEADGIGREPRNLVLSPDGSRAYVSAYVGDRITALVRRGDRYEIAAQQAVGRRPAGLSVTPDGRTVLVAHFLPRGVVIANEGWVSQLDGETLSLRDDIRLRDDFNLEDVRCLSDLFGVSAARLTTEASPTQLAGVFLHPSGSSGWVPGSRVNGIPILETGPNAMELSQLTANRPGELNAGNLYLLDTRDSETPSTMLLGETTDPPDLNVEVAKCAEFRVELEFLSRDVLARDPNEQINRAAGLPTGITPLTELGNLTSVAFGRDGRRAYVLSAMSDEIAVVDGATLHAESVRHFTLSGFNPNGMVVSPDGTRGYVSYENSPFVSVLDLEPLIGAEPLYRPHYYEDVPEFPTGGGVLTRRRLIHDVSGAPELPPIAEIGQVAIVDEDPIDPELRRGHVLFDSGNPDKHPVSVSRLAACAGCHPGGGTDGSLWVTVEGERRTMSLFGGVAGRGWLHASGTHQNIEEFVDAVVAERLFGNLDEADQRALTRYVAEGIREVQRPAVDEALAGRGEALFDTHCASCHQGPLRTSGMPVDGEPYRGGAASGPLLFDVGTESENSRTLLGEFFESFLPPLDAEVFQLFRGDRPLGPDDRLGEILDFRPRPERAANEYKAPALVNLHESVVYFHDGRYDSLAQVVAHFNDTLTLELSDADQRALVEYLKTL